MREQWCYLNIYITVSMQHILPKENRGYTSSKHLLCRRAKLLQDAQRLPEHAGSGVSPAFLPDLLPCSKDVYRGAPAALLHPGKKVQTLWGCVLGRQFSFSFQECALKSHLTQASEWGSCTHEVSAVRGRFERFFIVILIILFYYYYSGLTVTLWFKS